MSYVTGNFKQSIFFLNIIDFYLKFKNRNLKPSSLYITNLSPDHQTDKTKLSLSDYGVITPMRDALSKTRTLPGSFDYQAPEIFDAQSFNFQSDIWSIGAVLLDICTTSLYDVCLNPVFVN